MTITQNVKTGSQLLRDIYVSTDIEPLEFDGEWISGLGELQCCPALIAGDLALALDDEEQDDDGHMIYLWAEYVRHTDNPGGEHGTWEQIGDGAGTEAEARVAVERWLRSLV